MSTDTAAFEVSLAEELVLLMLDEKTGYLEVAPGWGFSCVMAGTIIADLALRGRIDTDLKRLYLQDSTPTGDELLDVTLRDIAKSEEVEEVHDAQYWIERNASRADEIVGVTLERLVGKGILYRELGGFFGLTKSVSRTGTYPSESVVLREAKTRIFETIFKDEILPAPKDAILIALMHAVGGFELLLEEEDYEDGIERINLLAKLDLVGRTVAVAVENSTVQPRRKAISIKPVPKVRVMDILRQRDFLSGNIARGLQGIHAKYGSVMQLPFKMKGFPVYAVMGADINQWVHKHSRFYFRSKEYIRDLENEFGSTSTLPGSDGADHYRMRKAMQSSYSRSALGKRLTELYHHGRSAMNKWEEGKVMSLASSLRTYAGAQISHLFTSTDCTHFSEELVDYEHRALITRVTGALPGFMMKTPKMRRYRKRINEFREMVIKSHTPGQRKGQPKDIVDGFIEVHKSDPQLLSETDLTFPIASSMVASIYIGAGLSFIVWCMLRNPEVYDGVYKEAEKLFGNGHLPEEKDFCPRNADITHRLIMETSRMYPVIPWQLRGVVNRCTYNGYEIPPESRILICCTAPHYNADLYKNPYQFDIDRYLPDRAEHKQLGAYAPYGLGTHTCLGRRYTELQLTVNTMLLAYHFKMEMVSKDRELKINPFPTCAPRKNVKFRITEIRNPIPVS